MLVKICDGRRSTYQYRKELRNHGFRYSSEPTPHWIADISDGELPQLEAWCFARRLALVSRVSERSSEYRKTFFEKNTGNAAEEKYFCAYCGRILKKDRVTVDHIISVKKAQTSRTYLGLLRKLGFETVNDVRNLVPSCRRCNSRKGPKGGLWILKGFLGKYRAFWIIVWLFYLVIFSYLLYFVVTLYLQGSIW